MLKQNCRKLLEMSPEEISKWLDSFDSVISDCDGVLWLADVAIEGSAVTINRLQEIGKKVFLCTNHSVQTRQQLIEKAMDMGLNIRIDNVISTAHSTAAYLKDRCFKKSVYIIGMDGIAQELDKVGIPHTNIGPDVMQVNGLAKLVEEHEKCPNVGAVVVGFDQDFSLPKMIKALSYLEDQDVLFIATNRERRFPLPTRFIPGTGCFVRAIEVCTGRVPIVIGKPNRMLCEWLITNRIIDPPRTLIMGDRLDTDIELGYNCGFQKMLIGTGINSYDDVIAIENSSSDAAKQKLPDFYLPKLSDLYQFLKK